MAQGARHRGNGTEAERVRRWEGWMSQIEGLKSEDGGRRQLLNFEL